MSGGATPQPGHAPFITLEGGEGSGKSTQARVLTERLRAAGHDVCLTQEPAGSPLGALLKAILERRASAPPEVPKDERLDDAPNLAPPITPHAELFLFAAARADHVRTVIRPALDLGQIVVCDRFADSTIAYQGYGRGLPFDEIATLNRIATQSLFPDLTLLLDLPPEAGLARAKATHDTGDKPRDTLGEETLGFHRRVREGFLAIAREHPDRVVVIDATQPQDAVATSAWESVARLLAPEKIR